MWLKNNFIFVHAPLHVLELDDSPRNNRAWLHEDLKVWDLQAHTRLAQKDRHLGFHKNTKLAILALRGFTIWNKKFQTTKCYPQWGLNLRRMISGPFWANLAFACRSETLRCLYRGQFSRVRRVSDLESEVPGSILIGVTFCYWNFLFSCTVVKPLMSKLPILLSISSSLWKPQSDSSSSDHQVEPNWT